MCIEMQSDGAVNAEGAQRTLAKESLAEWAAWRGGRVLVVDDSATNRLVTSAILSKAGFTVMLAAGGAEAVEVLRKADPAPEIVLMDVAMPDMDGLEATRTIRALPDPLGAVIVVALTAQDLPEDRERCAGAGMDDFLVKPAGRTALLSMLHRWLERA